MAGLQRSSALSKATRRACCVANEEVDDCMGCMSDTIVVLADPPEQLDRRSHPAELLAAAMQPEDLQLLVTRTMPFGKYKGRLIADLPGNYLNWFAREGFPPGEIGRLLALMQELDHNGLSHLLAPLRKR